ncbi:MAG: hypothetical protein FWD57_09675 [Polyangiaceae bacterium]|nr:hypothetical protein [Polyangiaceae bacterium]
MDRSNQFVPNDTRDRKGSFYTPRIWVELSHKYIAHVLGKRWQDEYTVWDCAAGTGNLLMGLENKNSIWASTLDMADVDVMKDRIHTGVNLLQDHVFQFDFLNDDFENLPDGLRQIIGDEDKRKKLIIYINPPYAEATSTATRVGTKMNKTGVATGNRTHTAYSDKLGKARKELFAQFLARIYFEIPGCIIGEFSTQKALTGHNFNEFREFFLANLKASFVVPANTFDNVKGEFPIGFKVWDTAEGQHFKSASADVYDAVGSYAGKKTYRADPGCKYINDWIKRYRAHGNCIIAKLCYVGNDFQNNNKVQICSPMKDIIGHDVIFNISEENIIAASIYFAVRKCVAATWLNDRDQFLYPNSGWENDGEFQSDCLTYALFNNNIQSKYGTNHWIPYKENEVNASDKFNSSLLSDFMARKMVSYCSPEDSAVQDPWRDAREHRTGSEFSREARYLLNAGKELWKYYHAQPKCNVNASLYDIREHFQGRKANGRMNCRSSNETYNGLIANLRFASKTLAAKIESKVYAYGFLKE